MKDTLVVSDSVISEIRKSGLKKGVTDIQWSL